MQIEYNILNILLILIIQFKSIFTNEVFDPSNDDLTINYPKNCKKISLKNRFECIECKENYTLLNGQCPCYDRNCLSCSSSYFGGCEKCNINFELDEKTKSCKCEIKHCLFCNERGCDQCETGYKLVNGECNYTYWECYDKACEICSNQKKGGCKKCYDGYNLESGNCILNPYLNIMVNNRILCQENYFSVYIGCNKNCLGQNCTRGICENKCLKCNNNILSEELNCKPLNYCNDSHCIMCRNNEEGFCDRCEIGYRLQNGECQKCKDKNCLNCDYTDDGSCNSCMFNFTLINGECYSNHLFLFNNLTEEFEEDNNEEHNSEIEDSNSSENKDNNFENEEDKEKKEMEDKSFEEGREIQEFNFEEEELYNEETIEYEEEYNNSLKGCFSYLILKNEKNYCTECKNNYTLINGKCYKCDIENCEICSYEEEDTKCIKCKENYLLTEENTCEESQSKIKHCFQSQNSKCFLCEKNYDLLENKCIFNSQISDCTSYECMSFFDEKKRNQVCEDNKYYQEKSQKCTDCNDINCRVCIDKIGCIICQKGLTLIEGRCLNSTYFANTIDGCALYDNKGNCLTCEAKCTLEDNECICQSFTTTILIILFVVIIIILIIFFVIFLKKKNQVREYQERQEANFKKEEIEFQLLENAKLKDDIIDDVLKKDSQLRKCNKCKSELAMIQLDCGCLLCKEDSKDLNIPPLKDNRSINNKNLDHEGKDSFDYDNIRFNNNKKFREIDLINENKGKSMEISTSKQFINFGNNNKNKINICPVCYKHFNYSNQISFQCEICFDVTSKLFNFNCGCALAVCKNCFNKIIKIKKCPVCRKDIINH
jgi:hypothetical protein